MTAKPVTPDGAAPPPQSAPRGRLRPEVALDLAVCGVLIAGLPFVAQHLQPHLSQRTLGLGLVGGALCLVWSVLAQRGPWSRWGATVTLAAVACGFVGQAVQSWQAASTLEPKGRMVAALMVVLTVFCVGTLANVAREGRARRG